MFLNKRRVDEDLEIIRRSLLDPGALNKDAESETKEQEDSQEKMKFSDFLMICGTAFSVILPWALAFAAVLGLVGWLLILWLS